MAAKEGRGRTSRTTDHLEVEKGSTWHGVDPKGFPVRRTGRPLRFYRVANCASAPNLQEPLKDPASFSWHEATRVQHYWLDVNAMKQPMDVREDPSGYEEGK